MQNVSLTPLRVVHLFMSCAVLRWELIPGKALPPPPLVRLWSCKGTLPWRLHAKILPHAVKGLLKSALLVTRVCPGICHSLPKKLQAQEPHVKICHVRTEVVVTLSPLQREKLTDVISQLYCGVYIMRHKKKKLTFLEGQWSFFNLVHAFSQQILLSKLPLHQVPR